MKKITTAGSILFLGLLTGGIIRHYHSPDAMHHWPFFWAAVDHFYNGLLFAATMIAGIAILAAAVMVAVLIIAVVFVGLPLLLLDAVAKPMKARFR